MKKDEEKICRDYFADMLAPAEGSTSSKKSENVLRDMFSEEMNEEVKEDVHTGRSHDRQLSDDK